MKAHAHNAPSSQRPRDLLQRVTGLNQTETEVQRAMTRRMRALGIDDNAAYLRLLNQHEAELQALAELLVVPESWMFRDAEAFQFMNGFVQRRLAAHPARTVRIASIPCAGGEEPYSIAMSLRDAGVHTGAYSIDGFDLSAVSVARARRGLYTRNAFRGNKLEFRSRYFTLVDGEYEIDDSLRQQVSFNQGNLMAPDFASRTGHYDVIFCRNLLIYFDEATTAAAIASLSALLADDGVLLAGYAEVPSFCRNGFAAVRAPGAFALVKAGSVPALERRAAAALSAAPLPAPQPAPRTRPAPVPRAPEKRAALPASAPAAAPVPLAAADIVARARAQADKGDFRGAADACSALLQTQPGCADAYFILGMVSECQQQSAQAGEHWRRCVYLQPDHYDALCHLALLAEAGGERQQAAAYRQRAARIYQRLGDSAGAVRKGKP